MAGWINKLLNKGKTAPKKDPSPKTVPAVQKTTVQETKVNPKLSKGEAKVNLRGEAVIPEGTVEILPYAFENNKLLRSVKLPGLVKKIHTRAFALCTNLEKAELNEGLEVIEGNVFNGCSSLHTLVLPDSIRECHAYCFYQTAISEPVYNRSGDILYHYPDRDDGKTVVVPRRVKVLAEGAFFRNEVLEEAILPDGLERIARSAFLETSIQRLTVPASVKTIEPMAFWNCRRLELINIKCCPSSLGQRIFHACPNVKILVDGKDIDFEQELRLNGKNLLGVPVRLVIPDGDFWKRKAFTDLATRCAGGDANAMMDFADYFESLGSDDFFRYAANFWRYRAHIYGSAQATEWKNAYLRAHPREHIISVMNENLTGSAMGIKFRALGFLFFDPEREYSLGGIDKNGIVEVNSWSDEEGPDEDGFGREELYDWWYLDEHLNPIPGVKMIHNYSRHDREAFHKRFDEQYAVAVKAVKP